MQAPSGSGGASSRARRTRSSVRGLALAAVGVAALLGSCFAEPAPPTWEPPTPVSGGGTGTRPPRDGGVPKGGSGTGGAPFGGFAGVDLAGDGGEAPVGECPAARPFEHGASCWPVETSEPLPSRRIVSSGEASGDQPFFIGDLFQRFSQNCGCHVSNTVGGFHATALTFSDDITERVMQVLRSDDEAEFMPPKAAGGKPFSTRSDTDSVKQLVNLLDTWISQGKPRDLFVLPASQGGVSPFHMGSIQAQNLTNLGSCIPDAGLVGTDYDRMCQMDGIFAGLQKKGIGDGSAAERLGLPERLELTDLNSFDTELLARQGVVAYAPGYPLWSDDAGKLRFVRVPLGQQIRYDEKTREFSIPPNTRFYKTFLKKTLEADGVERYRKVETRLIVARPPQQKDDGTWEQQALFGTYVWSDDESTAVLVTDPLRSDQPFADRIQTLIVDEPGAAAIRAEHPDNASYYMDDAHVVRRYAIPGSERCIQCHMGSVSQSFVLGFSPLQVNRRPEGEGGVIAPTGPDELTQLDRLIDYGLIAGLKSAKQAPRLEDSQLPRKPRNEYELRAQSYLFGNCGHCHNPNGFPSVTNPALAPLLRFWPSLDGGIFEFPLDRTSPRIHRGSDLSVELPYITPSLRDLIPDELVELKADGSTPTTAWRPKLTSTTSGVPIDAPWRSVIYRNVDTPFTYSDDYAIFPHMPMNTAGYDCRVARILGDWMVSIPSKRPAFSLSENYNPPAAFDNSSQPYVEVKPGDLGYEAAAGVAKTRLDQYHAGARYAFCADTGDIQDRGVLEGERAAPQDGTVRDFPEENVPDRPHWSPLDLTETAGDWAPRRADWNKAIVEQDFGPELDPGVIATHPELQIARDSQKEVVEIVRNLALSKRSEFKDFALTQIPFGLWEHKDGCTFPDSVRRAGSYAGAERPRWMDKIAADTQAPVYETLPGAAIYGIICINCHGEQADSNGRQAATLSDMTGGSARVANFKTGFFGNGGANITRVFGEELAKAYLSDAGAPEKPATWTGDWPGEPEDWAARYMPWMALGGTLQRIPPAITNLVAATEVLGVKRNPPLGADAVSANMLAVAQRICLATLPVAGIHANAEVGIERGIFDYQRVYDGSGLILDNGDAELWERICNFDNPSPVRVLVRKGGAWVDDTIELVIDPMYSFYDRSAYPTGVPVGMFGGEVAPGIEPGNGFPWCVEKPTDPGEMAAAATHTILGAPLPFCPDSLLADQTHRWQQRPTDNSSTRDDFRKWGQGGAVNAGMAVFLYLQQVLNHGLVPKPRYDQCERLVQN